MKVYELNNTKNVHSSTFHKLVSNKMWHQRLIDVQDTKMAFDKSIMLQGTQLKNHSLHYHRKALEIWIA